MGQYGIMSGNGECRRHKNVSTKRTITCMEQVLLHYLTLLVCTENGMDASLCKLAKPRALGNLITRRGQSTPRRGTRIERCEQLVNNEDYHANDDPEQHAYVYAKRNNSLPEQMAEVHGKHKPTVCSVVHCDVRQGSAMHKLNAMD